MKLLVSTKRVIDTDQRVQVRDNQAEAGDADSPYIINPFDAIALEEALRLQESSNDEVEVVIVGIGQEDYEQELRTGLGMGADRAIWIETPSTLDPWHVAKTLAALVEKEAPDIVLMGKQAVDDDSNQTGQFLAAILGWPQATFASRVEMTGGSVRIDRETDRGVETILIDLPAVITTDLRLNEPRYASLPSILRAKKKKIEQLVFSDLAVELDPRIEIKSMVTAALERKCVQLESVEQLAEQLGNSPPAK
ncbi:MAG: electron transfer flavoprotein subunit beta [Planctomycetaceae bacterium]|nr:electron transfer flavoprotein subunit beta [Planctomycetaceae bacterium]